MNDRQQMPVAPGRSAGAPQPVLRGCPEPARAAAAPPAPTVRAVPPGARDMQRRQQGAPAGRAAPQPKVLHPIRHAMRRRR